MKTIRLAIIKYKSIINGEPSGSVDYSVHWFRSTPREQIEKWATNNLVSYKNYADEDVLWEFDEVVCIEEIDKEPEEGQEVIGFITE